MSANNIYWALKYQFIYLMNMEPVSITDMYVQAWRGYSEDYSNFDEALSVLDKLPQEKLELVIEAIEKSIKEEGIQNFLLREIKNEHWSKIRKAEDIMEDLKENKGEYKPRAVSDWLAHAEPDHPLIKMLAESDEPELRLLAMNALKENPTPANRAVLEKLLNDNDQQVREAAEIVASVLEELKNLPVKELL